MPDTVGPQVADRNAAIDVNELKDGKKGKRVFLLGNGPPLHEWTMAEIKALRADTIGMNRSWKPSRDGKHKGFQGTTYHCFVSGAHAYNLCDSLVKTGHVIAPANIRWIIDCRSRSSGDGSIWCSWQARNGDPTNAENTSAQGGRSGSLRI